MDNFVANVFLSILREHCRFAMSAAMSAEQAGQFLIGPRRNDDAENPELWAQQRAAADDQFWMALQTFVIYAANISKMLWPGKSSCKPRGEHLRRLLGVPDDSPLISRLLRNHLEHFDERLEEWARNSPNRLFFDRFLVGAERIEDTIQIESQEDQTINYMRFFNTNTSKAHFQGDEFDIKSLYGAVLALHQKLVEQEEASRPKFSGFRGP